MPQLKFRKIALLAVPVLLSACSGTTPVAYTGINSSALLQKNPAGENHVQFVYAAPGVGLAQYTRMIVAPVAIYNGPDQQFGSLSAADKTSIAG